MGVGGNTRAHAKRLKGGRGKRSHPVPPTSRAKIKEAVARYADFTGHQPDALTVVDTPNHDTAFAIGELDGVMYTTVRDGKQESYAHEFKKRSRPLLASSFDGGQLYILSGGYAFTDRGIVDR
ncbi:MAG: hypothetical protein GY916_03040 [Gammaproteobacteria bacterium]|nr:hypothetical protein [Gammaproteobacteria bacterium]